MAADQRREDDDQSICLFEGRALVDDSRHVVQRGTVAVEEARYPGWSEKERNVQLLKATLYDERSV